MFDIIIGSLSRIADTETTDDEGKLAHSFLIYLGTFMSIGGIIVGTLSLVSGLEMQSLFPYGYAVITIINFTYLYFSKNFTVSQNIQVFISLMLPFLFQLFLGGIVASGAVILWSILTILGSFTFQKKKVTIRWFGIYIFLVIISGFFDGMIPAFHISIPHVSRLLSTLFFTLNVTLISTIIFALFYYFVDTKEKLQHSLSELANTDPLTELPNRRAFFNAADIEFMRAKRYNTPFTILMIDIDFFKKINDTYGHAIGDVVLQKFALLLKKSARNVDMIGRYGGEEFIVLLPETPIPNVRIFAARVLKGCQNLVINTPENSFGFTVSIGLTQLLSNDESLSTVLKRADDALFKAKDMGRNQVQEG